MKLTAKQRRERDYWTGWYEGLQYLSRSPRLNKPQMEVLKECASKGRDELEKLGVKFTQPEPVA